MSAQTQATQPEMFVELSTDEQQLISGGQGGRWKGKGRCPWRIIVPRCGPYFRGRGGKGGGGRGGRGFDGGFDDF
ncbi:MAG: hypothetical protein EA343_02620 [Nodularia sp. (in: Bacteria)]|nr:MAG: hypothetical protein EA343_02620 [Nodularia sp. (in: cyanobacteria)]